MSIYSTITLTKSEAIKLIAEHICADANDPEWLEKKTDEQLLEFILFSITDGNKYSPFHDNNYWVDDNAKSNLAQRKEEKYL